MNENYEWNENLSSDEWDYYLSQFGGHPLQSAKWGDSKKIADKINDYKWIAFKDGLPVFLARFEERIFLKIWKIAWCPKGPLVIDGSNESFLYDAFFTKLRKKGFFLCATNQWKKIELTKALKSVFYTIWIDLTLTKEKLWQNLQKKCRSDIKRSKKLGVIIENTQPLENLQTFHSICQSISQSKGFNLCASIQMMSQLLSNHNHTHVESRLFIAKYHGDICGGAFLIRCGKSVHYIWGAVNRSYAHLCIGEALQWAIIEWSISKNCNIYDLEGISEKQDGGVDKFKKKFGGEVIAYSSIKYYPLGLFYKITMPMIKLCILLQSKIHKLKLAFWYMKPFFILSKLNFKFLSK